MRSAAELSDMLSWPPCTHGWNLEHVWCSTCAEQIIAAAQAESFAAGRRAGLTEAARHARETSRQSHLDAKALGRSAMAPSLILIAGAYHGMAQWCEDKLATDGDGKEG